MIMWVELLAERAPYAGIVQLRFMALILVFRMFSDLFWVMCAEVTHIEPDIPKLSASERPQAQPGKSDKLGLD